jgi:hypothetical protein
MGFLKAVPSLIAIASVWLMMLYFVFALLRGPLCPPWWKLVSLRMKIDYIFWLGFRLSWYWAGLLKLAPSLLSIACSVCRAWMHRCHDHMDVNEWPYVQVISRYAGSLFNKSHPWALYDFKQRPCLTASSASCLSFEEYHFAIPHPEVEASSRIYTGWFTRRLSLRFKHYIISYDPFVKALHN